MSSGKTISRKAFLELFASETPEDFQNNCKVSRIFGALDKGVITKLQKSFEDCAREADGMEFWFVRDLQALLDYDD